MSDTELDVPMLSNACKGLDGIRCSYNKNVKSKYQAGMGHVTSSVCFLCERDEIRLPALQAVKDINESARRKQAVETSEHFTEKRQQTVEKHAAAIKGSVTKIQASVTATNNCLKDLVNAPKVLPLFAKKKPLPPVNTDNVHKNNPLVMDVDNIVDNNELADLRAELASLRAELVIQKALSDKQTVFLNNIHATPSLQQEIDKAATLRQQQADNAQQQTAAVQQPATQQHNLPHVNPFNANTY